MQCLSLFCGLIATTSVCLFCSFRNLQCDAIAGLTVGLTVIPQGLAYAKIANLPPQVFINKR